MADDSIAQSEKTEELGPDEAIELVEDGKPASSASKPRRGVLWGAL